MRTTTKFSRLHVTKRFFLPIIVAILTIGCDYLDDVTGNPDGQPADCTIVCDGERPDFEIINGAILCKDSIHPNYQIGWRYTVRNTGYTGDARSIQAWLSDDLLVDANDTPAGGDALGILEPCNEFTGDFGAGDPNDPILIDKKYLLLQVDHRQETDECDESNNIFAISIPENYENASCCEEGLPDFTITKGQLLCPDSVSTNYQIAWRAEIKNLGTADSTGNVQAWLSEDDLVDASDAAAGGIVFGNLTAGQTTTETFGATLNGGTVPERYSFLLLQADWQDAVEECDETNNVRAIPIPKGYPDTLCCDLPDFPAKIVTEAASFTGRGGHTSFTFNDRLWIIGGQKNTGLLNDVWSSLDGVNWEEMTSSAPFSKRSLHTATVYDNKIWVIGGADDSDGLADVWYSANGYEWNLATSNAAFGPRSNHVTMVFDRKLWVIAGNDGELRLNDVWYSSDGSHWTMATENAFNQAKSHHRSLAFQNKMWVIGGLDDSEVYSSSDGFHWYLENSKAPFGNRYGQQEIVFKNKMWLVGGGKRSGASEKDAWYSTNGKTWKKATEYTGITPISGHSIGTLENKLYIIGGWTDDSDDTNTVWAIE